MKQKQLISSSIDYFYTKASEETRLNHGMGVFEFERTKSLIQKYVPQAPSTIIDVGGGTGKYAEWLAQMGHQVHLVEPVMKHLHIARNRAKRLKKPFEIHQGISQQLNFPNNAADIVLLHGPLYHLQSEKDRAQSIREAKRVVKKNGIILGFAINYTASTLVGLLNGLIHKKSFFPMCREELTTSQHNPPEEYPWLLAEAYYHKPEQLKREFSDQNVTVLNLYAIEGMAWLDKSFFSSLLDEEKKKTLIELLEITQNDHNLLPFSPHMMIAAKKEQ